MHALGSDHWLIKVQSRSHCLLIAPAYPRFFAVHDHRCPFMSCEQIMTMISWVRTIPALSCPSMSPYPNLNQLWAVQTFWHKSKEPVQLISAGIKAKHQPASTQLNVCSLCIDILTCCATTCFRCWSWVFAGTILVLAAHSMSNTLHAKSSSAVFSIAELHTSQQRLWSQFHKFCGLIV